MSGTQEGTPQEPGGLASTATFVSFMSDSNLPERKGGPRLSHKKSRTGCQRCRARRVKAWLPSFLEQSLNYGAVMLFIFAGPSTNIFAVQ